MSTTTTFALTAAPESASRTSSSGETALPAIEPSSVGWAIASLSLSMLLPSLGTGISNVALPTFSKAFGASFQEVQWVVLAYLLATTTLVVSVGKLGDLVGRRRLLIAGISLFTVASVACAFAPSLWLLIAARAAQGAGAAVMMALTMAFVGQTVPKARTGSVMGLLGTMSAVGTALGPSLGGLLIAGLGWQAIFAINLPPGIAAVLLAQRHLPADRSEAKTSRPSFDIAGTLLLALTLAAYALAVTIGRGGFGAINMSLLAAAIVGIGLFVLVEARVASPLIRLTMFRDRMLSAGLATSTLVSAVVMAILVVGPFYLSRGLQLGTAVVGLVMSIGPLVAALTGAPAGRLVDRVGAHRVACAGLMGMGVGCIALFATPAALGVIGYVAPIVVITAGYAAFQAANNTAVMANVQQEQRGVVAGLLTLSRNLGRITGTSVMGAVFAIASGTVNLATAHPDAVATGMRFTFAVAAVLILVALAIAVGSRAIGAREAPSLRCKYRSIQRVRLQAMPSTAQNKEVLMRFIREVWSEGDVEAADKYVAQSYSIRHDPGDPWEKKELDLAGYKDRVRQSRAPFPDQRFEILELLAEGDAVLMTWLWSGTHKGDIPGFPATNKQIKMSGATLYYFSGERVTGHWQITDRLGVYMQLRQAAAAA